MLIVFLCSLLCSSTLLYSMETSYALSSSSSSSSQQSQSIPLSYALQQMEAHQGAMAALPPEFLIATVDHLFSLIKEHKNCPDAKNFLWLSIFNHYQEAYHHPESSVAIKNRSLFSLAYLQFAGITYPRQGAHITYRLEDACLLPDPFAEKARSLLYEKQAIETLANMHQTMPKTKVQIKWLNGIKHPKK